jgi:C4-dicarboxylate-specific signal transduction histidine kinase
MKEPNREQELLMREQEIQQRELDLRLRELDAEVNQKDIPYHPTKKHEDDGKITRSLKQDLVKAAKLSGLFLGGVAVVWVSQWLAWISLIAVAIGAGYAWFKFR